MVFYKFKCNKCSDVVEQNRPMAESQITFPHEECGGVYNRDMASESGSFGYDGPITVLEYYDVQLDCMIESRSHLKKVLKQRGLVEVGEYKTVQQENAKREYYRNQIADQRRQSAAEKIVMASARY